MGSILRRNMPTPSFVYHNNFARISPSDLFLVETDTNAEVYTIWANLEIGLQLQPYITNSKEI